MEFFYDGGSDHKPDSTEVKSILIFLKNQGYKQEISLIREIPILKSKIGYDIKTTYLFLFTPFTKANS